MGAGHLRPEAIAVYGPPQPQAFDSIRNPLSLCAVRAWLLQDMLLECGGLTGLLAVLKVYIKAAKAKARPARSSLLLALGLGSAADKVG